MRSHIQMHSLQQGLGLPCWVIWTKVLVLLHLLLQGEELTLQLTAQTRQGVPDVVGQLLETNRGGAITLQNQWHGRMEIIFYNWKTNKKQTVCNRPGWVSFVDVVCPFALLYVCKQGGTGRTSSLQLEQHEYPSSHQCLSDCGSPHQCSLYTQTQIVIVTESKKPVNEWVCVRESERQRDPHLYAAVEVYFQECPLHPSLHPSGPVLLKHQWYAHLHKIIKCNCINSNWFISSHHLVSCYIFYWLIQREMVYYR